MESDSKAAKTFNIHQIFMFFLAVFLLFSLVWVLWYSLESQERNNMQNLTDSESDKLIGYIADDLNRRVPALTRMTRRWETRNGMSSEEFLQEAWAYYEDWPGFQAIEWVDPQFIIQWIVPLSGNEAAVGLDLANEATRKKALYEAKYSYQPTMTSPIDLVQGGKGFLLYFPLRTDRGFDGFLLAVFRIEEWVSRILDFREDRYDKESFVVSLSIDDIPVFHQQGWEENKESPYTSSSEIILNDFRFTLQCRATDLFIDNNRNALKMVLVFAGLFISLLLPLAFFLSLRSSKQAQNYLDAKEDLQKLLDEYNTTENELADSNSRLTLATNAGNIGVWEWNLSDQSLSWNHIMYEIYGVSPDIHPNHETWRSFVHPSDLDRVEELLQSTIDGKAAFDCQYRICLFDGSLKYIRSAARVKRDARNKALQMTGTNWDITAVKEAEETLALERRRLQDILKGTNVGTWEWNVQTGETIFNDRWAEIAGYRLSELEPINIDTWTSLAHPEDLEESGRLLNEHFEGKNPYYECEARMKHKDGHWVWVLDRGKVSSWTEDGKPLLMSGTHADITERKKNENTILHMASHDALTDLPSLRLAKDRIAMAIKAAQRNNNEIALMFVDLDGFKGVNDTYGHDAGDEVLKTVSSRLKNAVRQVDTVARIGGDEFLVLLAEKVDQEGAGIVAKKIISTIGQSIPFKLKELHVGCSIGISLFPKDGDEVETLIKSADSAMYKIKKSGKNDYTFA